MSLSEADIKQRLSERVDGAEHVAVEDQSGGCGQKFAVLVVSSKFDGVSRLERHRMVNKALEVEMANIHALSIKTLTPTQWSEKQKAAAAATTAAATTTTQ